MSAVDVIAADVRGWYGDYLTAFTRLARGENSDLESLLQYYAVPSTIISDNHYLAFADRSALLGYWGTLIGQLRQTKYARSDVQRLDVRSLNPRAALIEGTFSRHDSAGNEIERFGTVYLAAKTDQGWRFVTVALTSP
jgi:hypothetical protein